MTDGGSPPSVPASRRTALGLRLALAFISVALAAVALLAGLTAGFAAADVSALATRQHAELTNAIAVAAGAAWDQNDSWAAADLSPVLDLAGQAGADVQIRDRQGSVVTSSPGFTTQPAGPATAHARSWCGGAGRAGRRPVHRLRPGQRRPRAADRAAAGHRGRGRAGRAAGPAHRAGRGPPDHPAGRADHRGHPGHGRGRRTARVGPVAGPAELRELAAAFDQMADTLDRQEQLRRDLVADVAHELRTPVAVLQAGHEALLDGITEPTPDQLASLRDEVLRLARMLTDLQDLAAADAAALHLSRRRCDLADIAAAAADSLAGQFEAAGITLERRLAPAGMTPTRAGCTRSSPTC